MTLITAVDTQINFNLKNITTQNSISPLLRMRIVQLTIVKMLHSVYAFLYITNFLRIVFLRATNITLFSIYKILVLKMTVE